MLSPLLPSPLPVPSVHLDGTPPLSCKARRTDVCACACVCLDVRGSQLQDFLVFAMPASGSCVRHAQWCEAGGVGWWGWGGRQRERGRGDWSGVEERQREKRDLRAQGTLQGQPSTSVEWGTAVHWLHNVHGIRGRRSTPTPAARLSKVARRSSREHINQQRHTENNRGAIYRAQYHLDFFYVQTEVIK